MIYSTGCRYAIRAMTRIAQLTPQGGFCLLKQIVEEDSLPGHYVGKLLQELVKAEILISAKGRNGGFALRNPPSSVTLRQIVEAIDGPDYLSQCVLGFEGCDDEQHCPHHDVWKPLRKQVIDLMDSTSLADLVESLNKKQRRRR